MWFSKRKKQGCSLNSRITCRCVETSNYPFRAEENLVTEFQFIELHEQYVRIGSKFRIPAGFDFLFYSNEMDLEKVDKGKLRQSTLSRFV